MKKHCYSVAVLCCLILLSHAPAMGQQRVCADVPLGNVLVVNDEVRVAILISEPDGIDAWGMTLIYDNTKVTYSRVEASNMEWFILNGLENTPGEVTMGAFASPPLTPGAPDTLCYVVFTEIVDEPDPGLACFSLRATGFTDFLSGTEDCVTSDCRVPVETSTWGRIKAMWEGR